MRRRNFTAFKVWVGSLPTAPTADDVRKQFGCSHTAAIEWINRLNGQRDGMPTASQAAAMATEQVLAALRACGEPLSVRGVADAAGLTAQVAMHALQNLYEASRVRRHGQTKPYTYSVAAATPDLSLLAFPPRAHAQAPSLVASVGVPLAALATRRIAA